MKAQLLGYYDGWTGHSRPRSTLEYRRGYKEGREARYRADSRRDRTKYQVHLGIGRSHRDASHRAPDSAWRGTWRG